MPISIRAFGPHAQEILETGGENISAADRKILQRVMDSGVAESGDKEVLEKLQNLYLKRNDGGIARKTRIF